jgi:archaellin
MSNSSQPKNYTDDLLNEVMISAGGTGVDTDSVTITLPSDTMSSYSGGIVTLTGSGAGSVYTINTTDTITLTDGFTNIWTNEQNEWVDKFPEWDRIKDMCKQYPSLEIALRNFETIYKLVKDDYDNPTPKK